MPSPFFWRSFFPACFLLFPCFLPLPLSARRYYSAKLWGLYCCVLLFSLSDILSSQPPWHWCEIFCSPFSFFFFLFLFRFPSCLRGSFAPSPFFSPILSLPASRGFNYPFLSVSDTSLMSSFSIGNIPRSKQETPPMPFRELPRGPRNGPSNFSEAILKVLTCCFQKEPV